MFKFLLVLALLSQRSEPIKLTGGMVSGTLRTSDGAPMSEVRVAVIPADGTDAGSILQGIAQTEKDGKYRIENIPPGRYHVMTGRIDVPLYHPGVEDIRLATTIIVKDGDTTQVADMVFARTRVTGRVIDAVTGLGRRVQSLSICCEYAPYSSSIMSRLAPGILFEVSVKPLMTPVNDDGSFEFSAVPAGNQYFQVFDPEIASFTTPVTITSNDMSGVEVRVPEATEIRGKAVDRLGIAVGGVSLKLSPKENNSVFELGGKPSDGFGVISSRNSSSGTNPLKPSGDDILARLYTQTRYRVIPIGPNGSFNFSRVLPGGYIVEIFTPGGSSTKREVEVGSQPVDIQFELPLTQVSGRVVGPIGGIAPALKDSVRIMLYGSDGKAFFCLPDADGRFYQLLPPGEYRVATQRLTSDYSVSSISDGSHDYQVQPLTIDGSTSPEIRITLKEIP